MEELDVIVTLTGCLAAALVCGYVTHRLGLSPIVGYLLAGVVVGPNTPGFVANRHLAEQFAEVGVVLLMFGVGLQFHAEELLAVRRVAVPGAVGQSLAATVLGTLIGLASGWGWSAGIVFGLCISVASTVVLVWVLADHGEMHTTTGHIAMGWLVVEDLLTVIVLVLLPAVFGLERLGAGGLAIATGLSVLKVGAMVALIYLGGGRLVPSVLERVAATRSRELFTLTVLVLALGIAVGSAKLFDVSMALGAFLAGLVVSRSEFSLRAATDALPMRDAFAVLFFVSVGLLFDPSQLLASPGLVTATLAVIFLGKPLVALAIVLALRYPSRVAVSVAIALAQIGEFSFILATTANDLGLLDTRATSAVVAAGILSIALNPLLYRLIGPLERLVRPWSRASRFSAPEIYSAEGEEPMTQRKPERAVVVGHGPVGQTISRLLRERQIEPVVIDLNLETVRRLGAEGIVAIYGDARHRQTLLQAGVAEALILILSSSDSPGMSEIIRLARQLNPAIQIIARTTYIREVAPLRRAGADVVFSSEGELALTMSEFLMSRLSACEDDLERLRQQLRAEFRDGPNPPEARDRSGANPAIERTEPQ
jgi:CPA2 family monovalent cation:H+ antiporter-2